jgi:hypothetical protein
MASGDNRCPNQCNGEDDKFLFHILLLPLAHWLLISLTVFGRTIRRADSSKLFGCGPASQLPDHLAKRCYYSRIIL